MASQTDLDYIDLHFLGSPEVIATAVLDGPDGVALVDPGPSTTLNHLRESLDRRGIRVADVRQLLLTHIHLDHAGGTGTLVRENPAIEVYVHARGATHMIDPAKLMASAGRLYGQDMDRLWGEFLPLPADRVRVLEGGERIVAAGRELDVAYTPGHASHHVSYFDASRGIAFVGDTAGIRRGPDGYVMPPTPPPDIDLEIWKGSAERILAWDPEQLFLTHFGPYGGVRAHFEQLLDRLDSWSVIVNRLLLDGSLHDSQREQAFVDEAMLDLRHVVGDAQAELYGRAGRLDYSWQGLARYWRKRTTVR
jgi:glyoxylase-like metal-dependent hydrolase (beta-lactamase superfamily II)